MHEHVVFCHQDVYLPTSWREAFLDSVSTLDRLDPRWAVAGLFGATQDGRHVGHVWSSGINRLLGQPFVTPAAVESLDELLLVVRRSSGVRFDTEMPGYHLYGTDLVQAAFSDNLGAYAICAPAIHNSRPILYLPPEYLRAYEYVRAKWSDRLPIQNCISPIVSSPWHHLRRKLRCRIDAFRYGRVPRSALDRQLDCVAVARTLGLE